MTDDRASVRDGIAARLWRRRGATVGRSRPSKVAHELTTPTATSAGVVARGWYDASRQATLATVLRRCEGSSPSPDDAVVTSDPGDLHRLLDHLSVDASIIAI